jgi:hypothetical protein
MRGIGLSALLLLCKPYPICLKPELELRGEGKASAARQAVYMWGIFRGTGIQPTFTKAYLARHHDKHCEKHKDE